SVNTYNYNLASYLVDILLPISANQFTIKASFSFAHLAKKKKKKILHYLNTCHVNIKFTIEFEENNAISFLDILI
ncbi:unnamed protein product, partial [Porites evermanni]